VFASATLGSMDFEVVGEIRAMETIASGRGIRILERLNRRFGRGHWLKRKGVATIRLQSGELLDAEVHWYEAHGIGKRKMKIKRFL
jgi:hypothetical protein